MNRLVFFFQSASAGGVLLLITAIIGILFANSPLAADYFSFLQFHAGPLPILLWINDLLMAVFFLLVGLEVKREMVYGELNTNAKRFLPSIAALFGLLVPAGLYFLIAGHEPIFARGWGIPTATDIAFAIGIVGMLGSRVPTAMKVFLTTLAVVDDLMAIIIIAIFYTSSIHWIYLLGAAVIIAGLFYVNWKGYVRPIPYIMLGIGLWFCIFKSGLHATLAGVILAMFIPFRGERYEQRQRHVVSPVMEWEHALSNWVTFIIVPLFGFANAGVSFFDFKWADLLHPIVLGVAVGLFVGKQVGVFGTLFILVKTKLVPMPKQTTWMHVYGIALTCGIGFTMSLFVSLLAFPPGHEQEQAKVGVFMGSILSGLLGYLVLRFGCKKLPPQPTELVIESKK